MYRLGPALAFPDPSEAEPDGMLAVGGDLRPERLILAYRSGIFPWYDSSSPILWWSPDPRFAMLPSDLRVSKSMRQVLRRGEFRITFDRDFPAVIRACRSRKRPGQQGTWITREMEQAYIRLHELGLAHSAEAWQDGQLAGGLYGVSLGRAFFGESMFTHVSNASKAAFITLAGLLAERSFSLIDSQVYTAHLESLGARHMPRAEYLERLAEALAAPDTQGPWAGWLES
jgi:leucyl/phenylalanyl-tRNA--protein transferase